MTSRCLSRRADGDEDCCAEQVGLVFGFSKGTNSSGGFHVAPRAQDAVGACVSIRSRSLAVTVKGLEKDEIGIVRLPVLAACMVMRMMRPNARSLPQAAEDAAKKAGWDGCLCPYH